MLLEILPADAAVNVVLVIAVSVKVVNVGRIAFPLILAVAS